MNTICPKCKKAAPIEEAAYCPYCGKKLVAAPRTQKPKQRGNGQGTAYKRGKTWTAVSRHYAGGLCVYKSKGGFKTKTAALDWLAHLSETRSEDPNIRFVDLYRRWIDRHAERVSHSTILCYQSAVKYFEAILLYPFAAITTQIWQECVDACPHGTRTRENMKALATSLYKYAHELGIVCEDYAQHIYIKREAPAEKRAFTRDELEKLFAAAREVPFVDVILILCYTGFRINELLSMERSAFDPEALTLRGGSKTTAGKNRIVPVSQKILPFVMAYYLEDGPALICENGKPITPRRWQDLSKRALAAVDVRPLTAHECRHTFASLMKDVDAPTTDKKRLIGHTSDAMLEHYTHAQLDDLRSIIDRL